MPICDCSCSRQVERYLFVTVHVDDSLDGAYLGTIHVDDSLDSAYLGTIHEDDSLDVPIWDHSCRWQRGCCLFGTVHVNDSLDITYLGLFM